MCSQTTDADGVVVTPPSGAATRETLALVLAVALPSPLPTFLICEHGAYRRAAILSMPAGGTGRQEGAA